MRTTLLRIILSAGLTAAGLALAATVGQAFPPYQAPRYENRSDDTQPFYKNGRYDASIPVPTGTVPRDPGARPIRVHEIHVYFEKLAASTPRVRLFEYGRTYENRPLVYLVISSESNMAKLDQQKENMRKLANPVSPYGGDEIDNIIDNSPSVAWLAYSIHGDEISGADASVEVAYQLAAGIDDRTKMLRDSLFIVIDPSENPDGRERYLTMLQSHYSYVPSTDAQSLQHSGFWPWGRGNHYLFDLNRDWILLENVETQGKVAAILEWNPQMLVDAHEMGANSSFLFNPPREPLNKNIPDTIKGWWNKFSKESADAFDEYGWNYYTKEWHEEWYPGYGSAWALYIGAVGLLYEQSGTDGLPTRQRGGYILTYREAVHHQFVISIANLATTATNRRALLKSFYQIKVDAIEAGKKESPKRFILPSKPYPSRADHLARTLLGLGVRVERVTADGKANSAQNIRGKKVSNVPIPAGSYIVSLDQPLRPLIKAMLEFDPHMTKKFLDEERREQEKFGNSRLYEFSAWSLPLAYDIGALWTDGKINASTEIISEVPRTSGRVENKEARYGWVIDYTSDKAPIAALRLLSKGYKVQASTKPFTTDGKRFAAGSLVIRKKYNDLSVKNYLSEISDELGITVSGVRSALVQDGSDLGADSFVGLELPRVGLFGGPGVSFTSYGSLWHQLDQELKIKHSLLNLSNLGGLDLDRYNVLVIPSIWMGRTGMKNLIGKSGLSSLKNWVKAGGTLICVGRAANWAADSTDGISSVRIKRDALDKLDEYEADNAYELFQSRPWVDTNQIWHYKTPSSDNDDEKNSDSKKNKEKLEREDRRTHSLFHPRGVIFDVLLDNEHWLAYGCGERVPAGLYTSNAFMSKSPVQTVGRIAGAEECRLSGLLWPEARERWANTAYVTRESSGRGQIILFAGDPDFRAYWKGTARLFTNALTLGPGFGTRVSVGW